MVLEKHFSFVLCSLLGVAFHHNSFAAFLYASVHRASIVDSTTAVIFQFYRHSVFDDYSTAILILYKYSSKPLLEHLPTKYSFQAS
jgi:hypothetical protein